MSALSNDRLCLQTVPPKPRKHTHFLEAQLMYEIDYLNGIKQTFLMNKDDELIVHVPHIMKMRKI